MVNTRPGSASTSLFHESAENLALRLEQESSEPAREMAREARLLSALFVSWQSARPPDDVRVAKIQQLFDLNRRAMDLLSR
jgi:hypothetical protein